MAIQFSGIGSGLPVQEWIDAIISSESTRLNNLTTQKYDVQNSRTALNTVESKFSLLRSSIEELTDANLASVFDLFERKKATSSDDSIATASVSTNAAVQKIELEVKTLATSTTAQSSTTVGQLIEGSETFINLADGDAEEGTFSFYIDGVKQEFTIEEDDTLNDIVTDINNAGISGFEAGINAGKLEFKIDDAQITSFVAGSSSDTSNFLNVMNIATADPQVISDGIYDTLYTSTVDISKVDTGGTIVGNTANLSGTYSESSYTFKIGGTEFTIDSNTTFQDLIGNINADEDAGVIASYDFRENKLKLTAQDPGEVAINLEDTSGDFLEQMGLITAGGDSISSQTLGKNAEVYINGSSTAVEVNSNTLTSDISGLSGVTISLKNVTEVGETISLNVEQDTDALTSAVEDFITKFNNTINEIDSKTASGKDLAGEYSLVSLRNSLRTMATDNVDGLSTYDSFAIIGISTGSVGTSIEEETKTLSLDKTKFLEALAENPDEVKTLLIGDSEAGITGILQTLESKVESALDPTNGYFTAREDSYDSQISDLDATIERETEKLETREDQLIRQFNQMDQYISQLQSQSSALSIL